MLIFILADLAKLLAMLMNKEPRTLETAAKSEDQVKYRAGHNLVFLNFFLVIQLLSTEDQTLLGGGNALLFLNAL